MGVGSLMDLMTWFHQNYTMENVDFKLSNANTKICFWTIRFLGICWRRRVTIKQWENFPGNKANPV